MSFTSRASRGCEPCRKRKIKCDLLKPLCSPCRTGGRPCGGFRGDLDIQFIDETAKTKSKTGSRIKTPPNGSKRRSKQSPNNSDERQSSSPPGSQSAHELTLGTELAPDVWSPALLHFQRMYVDGNEYVGEGHYSYAASLYEKSHTHLDLALRAVALAAFSKLTDSRSIGWKSVQEYGNAVHHINTCIQNGRDVADDSMLSAVMLLTSFDVTFGDSVPAIVSWSTHVSGATKLLEVRGRKQLSYAKGRRMCAQAMSNMLIDAFVQQQEVPVLFLQLRSWMFQEFGCHPVWTTTEYVIAMVNYWAAYNNPDLSVADKIENALALDEQLRGFPDRLPERWKPVASQEGYNSDEAFNGKIDVYSNSDMAQLWSLIFMLRILLNATLLTYSSNPEVMGSNELSASALALLTKAASTIQQCSTSICALMPQLFDRLKGRDRRPRFKDARLDYGPSGILGEPTGTPVINYLISKGKLRGLSEHGNGLPDLYKHHVWPLYVVIAQQQAGEVRCRRWALEQMQRLAVSSGSRLAAAAWRSQFEDFPELGSDEFDWDGL